MLVYKMMNNDMKCRGFQYELHKSYESKGELEVCSAGFHACMNPIDCFKYYNNSFGDKRLFLVQLYGDIKTEADSLNTVGNIGNHSVLSSVFDNNKIVANNIYIHEELDINKVVSDILSELLGQAEYRENIWYLEGNYLQYVDTLILNHKMNIEQLGMLCELDINLGYLINYQPELPEEFVSMYLDQIVKDISSFDVRELIKSERSARTIEDDSLVNLYAFIIENCVLSEEFIESRILNNLNLCYDSNERDMKYLWKAIVKNLWISKEFANKYEEFISWEHVGIGRSDLPYKEYIDENIDRLNWYKITENLVLREFLDSIENNFEYGPTVRTEYIFGINGINFDKGKYVESLIKTIDKKYLKMLDIAKLETMCADSQYVYSSILDRLCTIAPDMRERIDLKSDIRDFFSSKLNKFEEINKNKNVEEK